MWYEYKKKILRCRNGVLEFAAIHKTAISTPAITELMGKFPIVFSAAQSGGGKVRDGGWIFQKFPVRRLAKDLASDVCGV